MQEQQWILNSSARPPEWFLEVVKKQVTFAGKVAAQLLWQRGIRDEDTLASFINPQLYQPKSPFEFGQEMYLAMKRLDKAYETGEKVCIWGDFDADGITSTSVLWDGLGQFFAKDIQLSYYIPNRLTESHGLNSQGIEKLAVQGYQLIVTCDTGSTNIEEIIYAQELGIDVVVTDHHTLPSERPPCVAIINPRYFSLEHPLFHLSGVAVAYKLVEALYETLPNIPQQPLEDLLDLVAVGLIADLVELSGDCRYLAQMGIRQLHQDFKRHPDSRRRPGVGKLLDLCHRSGDRPTDISFGLGPRINAVSRIQGDASFCVELLTSKDKQKINQLAEATELANTRRKSLQKDVAAQVAKKLSQMDLSTTSIIVMEDSQWQPGVLGLVAGQVAQETGRPTVLLSSETADINDRTPLLSYPASLLARGSARSINGVDLYKLVKDQAYLLHRFGGHPFAAGLSLKVENVPLFKEAINQQLRRTLGSTTLAPTVEADLTITVADLGKELFMELKLLEPCGMGNPVPKLFIENCWFEKTWHRNEEDSKGKKVQYIKSEFSLRDNSTQKSFPGVWWGHYKEEIPSQGCDCIVELDYNTYKKRYEVRLIAVRPHLKAELNTQNKLQILDFRHIQEREFFQGNNITKENSLIIEECPRSWDDIRAWVRRCCGVAPDYNLKPLILAWQTPKYQPPLDTWKSLIGIAKYLSRTRQRVTRLQLIEKLKICDRTLFLGLQSLYSLGFSVTREDRYLIFTQLNTPNFVIVEADINCFLAAVKEEQFQQQYFSKVSLSTIKLMAV
ncbi:MAG: single-stranded-DNA-specific exonuclease RecJ [Cyanobacteria bacterium P01_A01_bin.84]